MYSLKAMIKAPRETPVLLTFRKRVQRGTFAGSHEFKIVGVLQITDTFHTWEWLKRIRLLACDAIKFHQQMFWFFDKLPDLKGYADIKPLYLQTIESFPEQDVPLLLGWQCRYPLVDMYLAGE